MELNEAKIIADGIVKGFGMAANSIEASSEKNARAIYDGFRETARIIGESLGGTRAELMMDCLLKKTNGGRIPEPDSEEWNKCKVITKKVLGEFDEK